jgi:hypothetical protein
MYTNCFLQIILVLAALLMLCASCRHGETKEEVVPASIRDTVRYDSICFSRDILPIFKSNCAIEACHDAITGQEGIVFDSYETFFYKGFVPGNAAKSQVYNAIIRSTSRRMPPITTYPLDSQQIHTIKTWVDQGMPENACKQEIDTTRFRFKNNIYPIIKNNCFGCHNDKSEHQNTIRLQTYEQVRMYALNGQLLGSIRHKSGYKPMPENGAAIDEKYIRIIEKWVNNGALNN